MQTLTPFSDISSPPSLVEYGEHGTITVIGKDGQESRYPLNLSEENPEVVFGRHSACNIMIKIPSVSRKHAKIELIKKTLFITPVTQNSPTLLNDQPIYQPQQLMDGDIISIGGRHFRFDASTDSGKTRNKTKPPDKTQYTTGSSSGFTKDFQDSTNELCTKEISKKLFQTINLKEIQNQEEEPVKKETEGSTIPKDFRRHSSVVDSISRKENNENSPKTPPKSNQPKTPTSILRKSGKRKSVSFAAKMERPQLYKVNQKPSVIVRDKSPKTPENSVNNEPAPKAPEIELQEANAKWEEIVDEIQKQEEAQVEEKQDEKNLSSISNLSPISKQNYSYNYQFDEPSIELSNTIRFIHRVESTGINLAPTNDDSEEEVKRAPVTQVLAVQVKEFNELPQEVNEKMDISVENIYDCNPFTPSLKRNKSSKTPTAKPFTPTTNDSYPKNGIEANPTHPLARELLVDFNASKEIVTANVEVDTVKEDVCRDDVEAIQGSPDLADLSIDLEDEILIDAVKDVVDAMEVECEPTVPNAVELPKVVSPKNTTPMKSRRKSPNGKAKKQDSPVVVNSEVTEDESPSNVKPIATNFLAPIQEQSPERSPALDYDVDMLKSSPTDRNPDFTSLLTKASPNPFEKSPYKSKETKSDFEFTEDLSKEMKKKLTFEAVEEQETEVEEPKVVKKRGGSRKKKDEAPVVVEKKTRSSRRVVVETVVESIPEVEAPKVEKKTRGRKKKETQEVVVEEAPIVEKKTRGRKKVVEEPVVVISEEQEEVEVPKVEKKTRGRKKKAEVETQEVVVEEAPKVEKKSLRGRKKTVQEEIPQPKDEEPVLKEISQPNVVTSSSKSTTVVKTRKGKKKEVKSSEPEPEVPQISSTTIVKTRKNRVKK